MIFFYMSSKFVYASPWPFLFLPTKHEMKSFALRDQLHRHPIGEVEGVHLSQWIGSQFFAASDVIPDWFPLGAWFSMEGRCFWNYNKPSYPDTHAHKVCLLLQSEKALTNRNTTRL